MLHMWLHAKIKYIYREKEGDSEVAPKYKTNYIINIAMARATKSSRLMFARCLRSFWGVFLSLPLSLSSFLCLLYFAFSYMVIIYGHSHTKQRRGVEEENQQKYSTLHFINRITI